MNTSKFEQPNERIKSGGRTLQICKTSQKAFMQNVKSHLKKFDACQSQSSSSQVQPPRLADAVMRHLTLCARTCEEESFIHTKRSV